MGYVYQPGKETYSDNSGVGIGMHTGNLILGTVGEETLGHLVRTDRYTNRFPGKVREKGNSKPFLYVKCWMAFRTVYRERSARLLIQAPPADWDGVEVMSEK